VFASFLRLSESHLQPYVIRAATVCDPGCNRMRSGLQPYAIRAATACDPGCNRMWPSPLRDIGEEIREIQGRYRGDAGEMQGRRAHICCWSCCHLPEGETRLTMCTRMASKIAWRCGRDVGEMWARYGRDI